MRPLLDAAALLFGLLAAMLVLAVFLGGADWNIAAVTVFGLLVCCVSCGAASGMIARRQS